jgi:hypothetical protein
MIIQETLDEVTILEILDIHADELVEAFSDKIEERYDYIIAQLELENDGATDGSNNPNGDDNY